jgi:hypothetical protein
MSDPSLFENVRLKLDRAQSHLDELHAEFNEFRDREPYEWDGPHVDENLKRVSYLVKVHEEPKREWGLIIGDCIQNLRSALDHLIYALSAGPDGSPPANADICAFPISSSGTGFNSKRTQERISGVDPKARSLVKWWQPFRRGRDFAQHPLWVLRELSDWDKHRLLLVAGSLATSSEFDFSVPVKGVRHWLSDDSLKDGAPVAVLDYSQANTAVLGGGPKVKADVKAAFGYGISFLEGPAAKHGVTYVLEDELFPCVRDGIVPSFRRFF